MSSTCPDCGAVHVGETSCQSIFDKFLALEFTDPGYGEVHMLTVACFMIQHGRYSDEGLHWIADKVRLHLEEGIPFQEIRRQVVGETDQAKRSWKVTRRPEDPPQPRIAWSMTIADVDASYRDAESYRELIRQWARNTLTEMQPLLG